MTISIHKFSAIFEMKLKAIMSKNMIIYPILTLGMAYGMRLLYGAMGIQEDGSQEIISSMVLNMGLLFSTGLTGMMLPCTSLAEEKEKSTLRTLMTSSVNGLEFFLGSILPTVLVVMLMNILLIPISGVSTASISLPIYLLISLIATLTSCIIGMLVGLFAKNQMSAGTMIMPVMLIFTILPMVSSFVETLGNISKFLYTGVISEMVEAYAFGRAFRPGIMNIIILSGEIILAGLLFLFFYKRNGYEAD